MLPVGALVIAQKLAAAPMALEGGVAWYGVAGKVTTAIASVLTYKIAADAMVIALWVAALVTMVRIEAVRRGRLDWLHVATFVFFVLYIVLPSDLGTTAHVDSRVLIPLLICCIALVARLPARRLVAGAVLALLAILARVAVVSVSWANLGEVHAQHLAFIRQLPVGARILAVGFQDASRFNNDVHVIAWAVPERQAMVSSLFAYAGQQPLRVSVNAMGPFAQITDEGMEIDVERVRAASFDYMWCFNPRDRKVTVPAEWTRVYSVSSITIWKIR
jgi:hypothetical protein